MGYGYGFQQDLKNGLSHGEIPSLEMSNLI